jgi:hypothetical protein
VLTRRALLPLLAQASLARAADDPRAIMDRVVRATFARNLRYEGMVTVFRAGSQSEKRWIVERQANLDRNRTIVRFLAPPEVKGVALLTTAEQGRAPNQWLYTPAMARVRRVAQHSRGGRFFATDLTFEDFEQLDPSRLDLELLGEEFLDGESCWRIRSKPRHPSLYDMRLLWISKSKDVILRQDLYAKRELVRRVLAAGHSQKQGVWTPSELEVHSLRDGGRTRIRLTGVVYDLPFRDNRFAPEALAEAVP